MPLFLRSRLDHLNDHVPGIVVHLKVPTILRIPVVFEDLPNHFRSVRQKAEQIDDEHRVPDPLTPIMWSAGLNPCVPQQFPGCTELREDALIKNALGQGHDLRLVSLEQGRHVHGAGLVRKKFGSGHPRRGGR